MGLSLADSAEDGEAFRGGSLSDAAGQDRQPSRRAPDNERLLRARAKAELVTKGVGPFVSLRRRSNPSGERRDERRVGGGSEGRAGNGITAPCNRLVGSYRGEASALFAAAEAGHRSKLRRLSDRRQLLWRYIFVGKRTPTHRKKGDLFGCYTCMIQIRSGASRLVKVATANQEINATPKARLPEGEHLIHHAGNLAEVLRCMNTHMHFLGGGTHESFKYTSTFQGQAVRRERPRDDTTERIEELEHRRVFERFAATKRERADAVRREIHA